MSEPGFINLRGQAGSPEFIAAVTSVIGQGLPVEANTMTIDKHRVFWLGPDEWLTVTPKELTADVLAQLREGLANQHAAVTDISGGNILLRLAGRNVRDVLENGCTLDFHPDVFPVGHCAQSGLAKASVLIGHVDRQPVYELIVRRSFSEYLMLWLQAAGVKYGENFTIA